MTPGRLVYGPSKAALIYPTRQLAAELGPDGIRANSISPGQTPTALRKFSDPAGRDNVPSAGRPDRPTKTGRIPLGRRGTLDDYVGAILFLICDLSAYVTGTDLLVDGGPPFCADNGGRNSVLCHNVQCQAIRACLLGAVRPEHRFAVYAHWCRRVRARARQCGRT